MTVCKQSVTTVRCGWLKTRFSRNERRRERTFPFRPTLESLERRELLSATGFEPVPISSTVAYPVEMNAASAGRSTLAGTMQYSQSNTGFTPDQIRHAYGFDNISFNNGTVQGDGSGQTIALIEVAVDQSIFSDASEFNSYYSLPQFNSPGGPTLTAESLTINGQAPKVDSTGQANGETALDVEWAHAIAPEANILLVYAPVQIYQNQNGNLTWNDSTPVYQAAQWAAQQNGVSVVSMSLGGASKQGSVAPDSYFVTPQGHNGVTFVASSGDQGQLLYPASSPNVLAVGGTDLALDGSGNYGSETVWNDSVGSSGGGSDRYYYNPSNPGYQKSGPDVAYNAVTFSVYDSGWIQNGGMYGTSAGAPQWAALIAIADQGRALNGLGSLDGSSQTLPMLYQMSSSDFHSNISGSNSLGYSGSAAIGLGTPYADRVVSDMIGQPVSTPPSSSPPSNPPPPAAPDPYAELAADALYLVQCYEVGDVNGMYAALMDYESVLTQADASTQAQLQQAFIDDVFADFF